MNFHRKGAETAEENTFTLAVEWTARVKDLRQQKSSGFKGRAFVLSGLSPESTKQNTLCDLCDSAVNLISEFTTKGETKLLFLEGGHGF